MRFLELPEPKIITLDHIRGFISDENTKRIHFETTHSSALFRLPNGKWYLKLPFDQPFESIARKKLNMKKVLFEKDNKYRRIVSDGEFESIDMLIKDVKGIVFLRDCLDLSIALCMHEIPLQDGICKRTMLGEYEFQLKYYPESPTAEIASQEITKELQYRLEMLPFFKDADYVLAVPSTRPFLTEIIQGLHDFQFKDISSKVKWINKHGSLKELDDPTEKLELIDSWGFAIDPDLDLKGKNILVVDDMYKSGVTMQYIGMKLKEVGASRVFGICICKALGNN